MRSNDGELTVVPSITITKQPEGLRTATNITAEFSVEATISDTRYTIEYYWTVDDVRQNNSNSPNFYVSSSTEGDKKVRAYANLTFESIDGRTEQGKPKTIVNTIQVPSDEVTWEIGPPRSIIRFEGFTPTGGYKFVDANLDDGDVTLDDSMFDSTYNIVTYYAREKDLKLTLHMDGAPGAQSDVYGTSGGQGGRSVVVLDHTQNQEHTVLGTTNNSAVFLYRGSNLLLVAGQGGQGGVLASGAAGGGVNVAGGNSGGNSGGTLIAAGQLTLNGVFGSVLDGSSVNLQGTDTVATAPAGGRTISCSKGSYWTGLGISPCENNSSSQIKFRIADGTEVTLSDNIIRGFKPGYTINTTEGRRLNATDMTGGRGATGGMGGGFGNNNGGGGGSGYTDGTADINTTQLGGVPIDEKAKIRFSLIPPPPKVKVGTVTHGFSNATDLDTFLNFDGAVVTVEPQNRGAADRQTGQGTTLKHYLVTMNADYSTVTVKVLQDNTAGGGPGMGLAPTKIEKVDTLRWRIWFNKANGFNTYARNWSVTGS